jgi:hypothetical protein
MFAFEGHPCDDSHPVLENSVHDFSKRAQVLRKLQILGSAHLVHSFHHSLPTQSVQGRILLSHPGDVTHSALSKCQVMYNVAHGMDIQV